MLLPRRLSTSTLGDLLGSLHRGGTTGVLELSEVRTPRGTGVAGRIHRVHLRGGLVAAIDTPLRVPRLGEILRREGLASGEVLRLLEACIEGGDRRAAGDILETSLLVPAEAICNALRAQLQDRTDALFTVEDATLRFCIARPLPRARVAAPLTPGEFLHGRPRARDGGRHADESSRATTTPPPRSGVRPVLDDPQEHARRLLGIPRGAGLGDVRRAFRKLAAVIHPDRLGPGAPDELTRHAARFAELSAAYHLLVA
jgi:hypothetical protein